MRDVDGSPSLSGKSKHNRLPSVRLYKAFRIEKTIIIALDRILLSPNLVTMIAENANSNSMKIVPPTTIAPMVNHAWISSFIFSHFQQREQESKSPQ